MSLIVMTFGAAALQHGDSLLTVAETLRQSHHPGSAIIAVVDALPGATDLLRQSIDLNSYSRTHNKLHSMYSNMARKLIREENDRALLLQDIADILGTYQWLGRSIINRSPTPTEAATMLATGERLSARLLAAALQHRGIAASTVNSHEILLTEGDAPSASLDVERSRQRCADQIVPLVESGHVVIVGSTGSSTEDNRPVRQADHSAYLTASLLATFCQADSLWVMQPSKGILTADLSEVPDAPTIPVLPLDILTDMANYGAEIPPAAALQSAADAHIPIFIRSIFDPAHPGTYIQPHMTPEQDRMGPLIVQENIGVIHTSRLEPEAGLKILHSSSIPAAMSEDGAMIFVDQLHLHRAHLNLSQAHPDIALDARRESAALVTILGVDPVTLDDLRAAMHIVVRNAGVESPIVMPTSSHTGHITLSALVPAEHLVDAIREIHKLIQKQAD